MKTNWSEAAVCALGVKTDVETAGSILGLSRTQSYQAVKAGRFPVPVISVGRRLIVPTAPIRKLLQIDQAEPVAAGPADQITPTTPSQGRHDHDTSAA